MRQVALAFGAVSALALPSPAFALTPAEWRADLHELVSKIREIHPHPFGRVAEADFDAAVAALEGRLAELSDEAVVVELQRIVALLRDGHSSVRFAGDPFDHQLPVVMYPFEEGLFVSGADREYADIVGGRVTKIGALGVDDALARIRPLISGENEFTILDRIPNTLTRPVLLHVLGVSSSPREVTIEVERDGATHTATVRAVDADAFTFSGPEIVSDGAVNARSGDAPLYLRDPRAHYHFEHVADEKLLYVQFNRVRNAADESLADFFERVYMFADEHGVETFVLDIRFNHGGNNQLLKPLVHGLIRRADTINRPGHFYTILGRGTFSAAITCTARLEEHTNVRFVGEPAGSAPIHYGDSELVTLTNSGIGVSISEWMWQNLLPWDDRRWHAPDIPAPTTFADYVAGRDAALEAVRNALSWPPLADLLYEALRAEGPDGARDAYAEYKDANPDRWGVTSEAEVNAAGYRLLGEGRPKDAIVLFELNIDSYPGSANCWDSLAEAYLESGDRERAIELYRRAVAVDPEFDNARRMLARLEGSHAGAGH